MTSGRALGHSALPQFKPLNFACGCFRQFGDEFDEMGSLMGR